jgi:hypothetical protein
MTHSDVSSAPAFRALFSGSQQVNLHCSHVLCARVTFESKWKCTRNAPTVACVQPLMYVEQATRHSSSVTNDRSECTALPTAAVFIIFVAVVPVPTCPASPAPDSIKAASEMALTFAASHAVMFVSVVAPVSVSYVAPHVVRAWSLNRTQ